MLRLWHGDSVLLHGMHRYLWHLIRAVYRRREERRIWESSGCDRQASPGILLGLHLHFVMLLLINLLVHVRRLINIMHRIRMLLLLRLLMTGMVRIMRRLLLLVHELGGRGDGDLSLRLTIH